MLRKLLTSSNTGGFGRLYVLFPYAFLSTSLLGYLKASGILTIPIPILAMSLFFLFAALLLSCTRPEEIRVRKSDFLLMVLIALLVSVNPLLVCAGEVLRYQQQYLEILFAILVPTLAGYIYGSFFEKRSSISILAISFATVLIVLAIDLTQNRYGVLIGRFGGGAVLALSDLLASSALFALYFLKGTRRVLLGLSCFFFLLLLSSFTSISIFSVVFLILLLSDFLRLSPRIRNRFSYLKITTFLVVLFAIVLTLEQIIGIIEPFLDSLLKRLNSVILLGDSSAVARIELLKEAASVIVENPLLGKWGYYFRESGYLGYAHNVLSWWADYGLITFLCVLIIQTKYVFLSFKDFVKRRSSPGLAAVFMPLLFLFIASLVSRAHRFELIWFYVGMSISISSQKQTRMDGDHK